MSLPSPNSITYIIGRCLHWIAAVVFMLMVAGTDLLVDFAESSDQREQLFFWHIGLGSCFFLLLFVRVGWMVVYPELQTRFDNRWQATAARINHFALYFLMVAMPLSGLLGELWKGESISLFGMLPFSLSSSILGINEGILADDLATYCEEIHIFLKWPIYLLMVLHIAGAVMHWMTDVYKRDHA